LDLQTTRQLLQYLSIKHGSSYSSLADVPGNTFKEAMMTHVPRGTAANSTLREPLVDTTASADPNSRATQTQGDQASQTTLYPFLSRDAIHWCAVAFRETIERSEGVSDLFDRAVKYNATANGGFNHKLHIPTVKLLWLHLTLCHSRPESSAMDASTYNCAMSTHVPARFFSWESVCPSIPVHNDVHIYPDTDDEAGVEDEEDDEDEEEEEEDDDADPDPDSY
jgi:hypothetical protein